MKNAERRKRDKRGLIIEYAKKNDQKTQYAREVFERPGFEGTQLAPKKRREDGDEGRRTGKGESENEKKGEAGDIGGH